MANIAQPKEETRPPAASSRRKVYSGLITGGVLQVLVLAVGGDIVGLLISAIFLLGGLAMRLTGRNRPDTQLSPIGVGMGILLTEAIAILLRALKVF